MHYDAQQAVNEDKAKFVDNAIRLTSAQIRDRYGIHQSLIAIETVCIRKTDYEIDVRLVASDDDDAAPYSEAVLFCCGHEVAVTKPHDEFFGAWELTYDEDSFTIELTR
jgi:hypothetical protein